MSGVVWDWRVHGESAAPGVGIHVTDLCDLPQRTRLQLLAELLDEMVAAAHRHYALTRHTSAAHRQVAAVRAIAPDPPRVTATRCMTLEDAVAGWRLGDRADRPMGA